MESETNTNDLDRELNRLKSNALRFARSVRLFSSKWNRNFDGCRKTVWDGQIGQLREINHDLAWAVIHRFDAMLDHLDHCYKLDMDEGDMKIPRRVRERMEREDQLLKRLRAVTCAICER